MVKSELVRLMMDMFHFGWVAGCAPFGQHFREELKEGSERDGQA